MGTSRQVTRVTSGSVPLVEIVITEPLNAAFVPRLFALLDEAFTLSPAQLVIDLAHCPSIDAAAIEALLDGHRRAHRQGSQLTLQSPSPRILRNLKLARLDNALHITPGVS